LGVGLWKSTQLEKMRVQDRVFAPEMKKKQRESLFSGWRAAVDRVL
jgi:glycerol kinase